MLNSWNPAIIGEKLEKLEAYNLGEFAKLETYDDTEVDTGKKWINGASIYRKVFYVEAMPNATSANFNHGIENVDVFISVEAIAQPVTGSHSGYPIPFSTSGLLKITSGKIYLETTIDMSAYPCYITVEYTKAASQSKGGKRITPVTLNYEAKEEK